MKIPPRKPPTPVASSSKARGAGKKAPAAKPGYADKSAFEAGAKKTGGPLGTRRVGTLNREISRDFLGIKRGLRGGDDPMVKAGVAALAQRLNLKLPDVTKTTGWGAFGALAKELGHPMVDLSKFNRFDYRHVMKLARALGGKINDPDPSNRL